jgi:hypothetical protein
MGVVVTEVGFETGGGTEAVGAAGGLVLEHAKRVKLPMIIKNFLYMPMKV